MGIILAILMGTVLIGIWGHRRSTRKWREAHMDEKGISGNSGTMRSLYNKVGRVDKPK